MGRKERRIMEHIIQFAVSVDDHAIEENVLAMATRELTKDVKDAIYVRNGYYGDGFTSIAEKIIHDAIFEYKDEIIEKSAKMLVDSVRRSKVWKEKLKEIENEEE